MDKTTIITYGSRKIHADEILSIKRGKYNRFSLKPLKPEEEKVTLGASQISVVGTLGDDILGKIDNEQEEPLIIIVKKESIIFGKK